MHAATHSKQTVQTHTRHGTILCAGGGTGGHLSPGIAVAEAIAQRCEHHQGEWVARFACSNRSIDAAMLGEAAIDFRGVEAAPFGSRPRLLSRFLRSWPKARRQADVLIDEWDVSVVLALGGFVAAPVVRQAHRRGIPIVMLNLDAAPGKANRLIARWCSSIISVCDTPGLPQFSRERVSMPLRQSTIAPAEPAECRRALGLKPGLRTLVVTGASQGAQSLNDLMTALVSSSPELLRGEDAETDSAWQVYHLAGHGRGDDLLAAYQRAGVSAVVDDFQHRMGLVWGAADLVISRAGANSVAEIAFNAVPAVFLPYPFHRDRHQAANAKPLCDRGASVLLVDHVDAASNLRAHQEVFAQLLTDSGRLNAMRVRLREHRPENGAIPVADRLIQMGTKAG